MLTFLSAEFLPLGAIRRYQHPTLGVLNVLTQYGVQFGDGCADVVSLHGALVEARWRKKVRGDGNLSLVPQAAERKGRSRAPRKRQSRERAPRQPDPRPAA